MFNRDGVTNLSPYASLPLSSTLNVPRLPMLSTSRISFTLVAQPSTNNDGRTIFKRTVRVLESDQIESGEGDKKRVAAVSVDESAYPDAMEILRRVAEQVRNESADLLTPPSTPRRAGRSAAELLSSPTDELMTPNALQAVELLSSIKITRPVISAENAPKMPVDDIAEESSSSKRVATDKKITDSIHVCDFVDELTQTECGKKFVAVSQLSIHKTKFHKVTMSNNRLDHECDKCKALYVNRSNLLRHQRSVHGLRN